jgi:hypothetical protein
MALNWIELGMIGMYLIGVATGMLIGYIVWSEKH